MQTFVLIKNKNKIQSYLRYFFDENKNIESI